MWGRSLEFLFLFRFNALDFLAKYRGKKIMFVGDSLSLNQFNSLACMIHSWVPKTRTSFSKQSAISTITFQVGFWVFFCFYIIFKFLFLKILNLMVMKWCLLFLVFNCIHAIGFFFSLLFCFSLKLETFWVIFLCELVFYFLQIYGLAAKFVLKIISI